MKTTKTTLGILFCLWMCVGCSVFEPREADPPDDGASPWQTPSVPTAVFQNMRTGLIDLTGANYERSLHSSFTYIPDPQTEAFINDPAKWANYTRQVEVQVTQLLLSEASKITVTFTNTPVVDTGTFAQFEGTYKLERTNQGSGLVETYEGEARYDLTRGTEGWQLSKWEDLGWLPSGNRSWGVLRATLRQDSP